MDWIINSQDFLSLIAVPIAIITVVNACQNWSALWDNTLTERDRALLIRIALFVLMPVIVLFHELGHAAATIYFGGKVETFHYGFLWGYVVPSGTFTELQILIIYLAGNVVEIILGLIVLIVGLTASSPPVVALSIYLSFWAIGGTLIFYTLLSVIGAYGDWVAIYTSPIKPLVYLIACIHAIFVAVIIWCLYAERPLLWFARKTNPQMVPRESELLAAIRAEPTVHNYLQLAWHYFYYGVDKQAKKYVNLIDKLSPDDPENLLLKGYLASSANDIEEAKKIFLSCASNASASDLLRCRAYLEIGRLEERQVLLKTRGGRQHQASGSQLSMHIQKLVKRNRIWAIHTFIEPSYIFDKIFTTKQQPTYQWLSNFLVWILIYLTSPRRS